MTLAIGLDVFILPLFEGFEPRWDKVRLAKQAVECELAQKRLTRKFDIGIYFAGSGEIIFCLADFESAVAKLASLSVLLEGILEFRGLVITLPHCCIELLIGLGSSQPVEPCANLTQSFRDHTAQLRR